MAHTTLQKSARLVGVLALQGGFAPHVRAFQQLGCEVRQVRRPEDLTGLTALAFPGGESTAQRKLIAWANLREPLQELVERGTPILGTCAGLILAAEFGWLNLSVRRNAWGRQIHSFEARADKTSAHGFVDMPLVFIRAPRIQTLGAGVEVLASYQGEPVLVRQGSVVGACFHPELTDALAVHQLVLEGSRALTSGREAVL